MTRRLAAGLALVVALRYAPVPLTAEQSARSSGGEVAAIRGDDLRQWLSYLASDELEGRATFSEGLGLAAAYIAGHLRLSGVAPGGDNGSYFQRVKVLGVSRTSRSTLTVKVGSKTRTFVDGEAITFPANVGGKRTFTADRIEFVGYGLDAPHVNHHDYADRNVKGRVAVWLGQRGPDGLDQQHYRRVLGGRGRYAIEQLGASATIGTDLSRFDPDATRHTRRRTSRQAAPDAAQEASAPDGQSDGTSPQGTRADFTTVQRLDREIPPAVTANDEFFEFLFSNAHVKYGALKDMAAKGGPLPHFSLDDVKITFDLDADYRVVRTQYTRNVVGILEGSDQRLKDTYVVFGAHYDHVGYAEGEVVRIGARSRRQGAVGRVKEGAVDDRFWNGADDDASGTAVLMSLAKAYASGSRPKRSLIFIWHAGEERGLWGSQYFADFPTVPIDRIVAQLNMDMVGRDRGDKAEEADKVYLVGSDRISTELHNLGVDTNEGLPRPLKLDYEMNDPTDPEQVYYRSDHHSYAEKGIPVILFTSGLHEDYHSNTDSVEKINFEKMTRIAQLVCEIGYRVANLDHEPVRDNRGPRVGKGSGGKILVSTGARSAGPGPN